MTLPQRGVRRALWLALSALLALYLGIAMLVWLRAQRALAQPPQPADAALVLGNRAWLRGAPNPCLTGRVDVALALARDGRVARIALAGGRDKEDGRIEAEVMAAHARAAGYAGPLIAEARSQTTRENLAFAAPLLQAAGVRRVIVVSEPYHLWRAERLARAGGFERLFEVQYAAAETACWRRWGMLWKGALREPLAIINNAARGQLF